MKVKSFYCRVIVSDHRCICGYNTRYKYFDTFNQCVKWVHTLNNRLTDWYNVRSDIDYTWKTYFIV